MSRLRAVALLALGAALAPAPARAHRNYSTPELAWTCKLGEQAVLCGMSAPAKALERVFLHPIDLSAPPSPAAQIALRDELLTLFRIRNPILIDGARVLPEPRSLTLLMDLPHTDLEDPALAVPGISLHQSRWAIVRLVLSYPIAKRPAEISMTWDTSALFTRLTEAGTLERVPELPGSLLIDGRWTEVRFSPDAPTFVWHADGVPPVPDTAIPRPERRSVALPLWGLLPLAGFALFGVLRRRRDRPLAPVVAAALVVVPLAVIFLPWPKVPMPFAAPVAIDDPARAEAIFRALHANIYRAFDQETEAAIYDTLARSVDGPLLEEVYTDVYESMSLRDDGGAICHVDGVDVTSVKISPGDDDRSFRVEARWRVTGTVTHEQHRHRRTNDYQARYTVSLRDVGWRLTAVEVQDLQRMATATQDVPLGDE